MLDRKRLCFLAGEALVAATILSWCVAAWIAS